jgi:hypothetical protein
MGDSNDALLIGNVIFAALFTISEVLGWSTCKSNGVFDFIITGIPCAPGGKIRIMTVEEEAVVIEVD